MTTTYFTISLDPTNNTIDDTNLSTELKNTFNDVFVTLLQDPTNINATIDRFQVYYDKQVLLQANVIASEVTSVLTSQMNNGNNAVQLDMDGNVIISNNQPNFATTKEEVKNILGSVEKTNSNEILIADSINKRAIIVDVITQKIKWEYKSDRYILDAHLVPQDNITIKINNSNYISSDIVVNKGQTVIWENNIVDPITIYSGDISNTDISVGFDGDLYGDVFKSITLSQGERWSFNFAEESEISWFSYPNGFVGKVIVSDYKISSANQFLLLECDGLESPYTGRLVRVDCWGNILWSFENYVVSPKDARPLLNNKVLISA